MPGASVRLSATANPGRQTWSTPVSIPTEGRATRVQITVPPGCQGLVDSRVMIDGQYLAPAGGDSVQGDGITWDLPADLWARFGSNAVLWVGNRDSNFPHTITAVVSVEEGEAPFGTNLVRLGSEEPPVTIQGPFVNPPPVSPPSVMPPMEAQAGFRVAGSAGLRVAGDTQGDLGGQAVMWLGLVALGLVAAVILLGTRQEGCEVRR